MSSAKLRLCKSHIAACVALLFFAPPLPAKEESPSARYTKAEHRIAMRDGTRLFTAVYLPKDSSRAYPILLTRTPYTVAPYGADKFRGKLGPSKLFEDAGYIFVYQDVRGKSQSEGDYVEVRPFRAANAPSAPFDEATDAYDTIEWLLANVPNHNGNVGVWGISYPGFYATASLINAHPAVKAVSPQAPITDWFEGDDWHRNGALLLVQNMKLHRPPPAPRPWDASKPAPKKDDPPPKPAKPDPIDGYEFFLTLNPLAQKGYPFVSESRAFYDELMRHDSYDAFWKARDIRPHLSNVRPAVLVVGGWFDWEDGFGALETYRRIERTSPQGTNHLVMGPWIHGMWSKAEASKVGNIDFGSNTSKTYQEELEFPFFEHHLKGSSQPALAEASLFDTGNNVWRKHDAWPPKQAQPKSFYFSSRRELNQELPPDEDSATSVDEYLSDPNRPVPFIDRTTMGTPQDWVNGDQRFASRRPDVLSYQTEPLESDLTVVGPIQAKLFVSTTGTDCDWIVKIIDVHPDDAPNPQPNPSGIRMAGFQQLVRGDVMRGKFRNGLEHAEPFEPGEPTCVNLQMLDIYHTFRKGHRLMVQVQSSWFPLVDRNPQQFTDINTASDADFRKATQRVFRTQSKPSHIEALVLPN